MADYNAIKWEDFVYYDETSPTFLRWKVERRSGRLGIRLLKTIGDVAGCLDKTSGYSTTGLHGLIYCTHRIIWVLFNGEIDPSLQIDHIDGNRCNNDIGNLRLVTPALNQRNTSVQCRNKTGVAGVSLVLKGKNYYYKAQWNDLSGKTKTRCFSIQKLGEGLAFTSSCEHRQQMIEELNANGAGYTERHGT